MTLVTPRFRKLAEAYLSYYAAVEHADNNPQAAEGDASEHGWASEEVMDMTLDRPHDLIEFVLEVLALNPPNLVREVLAAGPLEDYLATLGDEVIGDVERLAKSNPQFASLLGGVWKNAMSDDVWNRVQAVWDRRGWDGNAPS
jgi:hypothetical protein